MITKTSDEAGSCYRIKLDHHDAAKFDAALASHRDGLVAQWKRDHPDGNTAGDDEARAPLPGNGEAFLALIEAGWDADVARRPHGQHTTVVVPVMPRSGIGRRCR
ncbi:DUF222 domain-containing protein [Mycobacterium asiaticum]|uniref:DUF222 domain-containing protein n=1 Tax=Mycobacterium asiaticum TaxID=1790 RepID=UPI003CC7D1ED